VDSYRPGRFLRISNRFVAPLVRLGLPMGARRAPMALLTVAGRRSGQPRTAPVAVAPTPDGWTLIAAFGPTDWAKNLEAAGEAVITMRRKAVPVAARRLAPGEAAPVLRDSVASAPRIVQRMTSRYFDVDADAPLEAWERETVRHPVFALTVRRTERV
jgi:deazaflavin-dependent oxidoreductase (nitroreductase family)